jgi:hypothetical protein
MQMQCKTTAIPVVRASGEIEFPGQENTANRRKILLYVANFLDVIHIPLAIGVMGFGILWLPKAVYTVIVFSTVCLQAVLLGCPLAVLSNWLRRQYDPTYRKTGSLTVYLYRRHGRWVAVPILILLFALAIIISHL